MKRALFLFALTGPVASLSACSTPADYPSLARRPIERTDASLPVCPLGGAAMADFVAPTPAPGPPPPPGPEFLNRLAGLVEQARSSHARFLAERGRAEALISAGAGAPVASESWSVATVALAGLEATRSNTLVALADLDQLYAAARIEGSDSAAIAAARDQVDTWVAEEDRVLSDLRGRLGS